VWTVLSSVPNPWGQVPVSAGGRSVVPQIEAYMSRIAEVATKRDCVSRRHHYVPQSYLRAWSPDRKRVRVLDTRNGLDKLRGLRDTCVEQDFYRVTDSSNRRHNQVEAMLAVIDDETARLLQRLRGWTPGDDVQFNDFMSLAVVMGFQRNRTPQARRFITSMSDWLTRRADQPAQEFSADYYVDLLFRSVSEAADQFSIRQLELWNDPQCRFITCDQPVLFSQDSPGAPPSMDHSRHVWWPISPSRMVVLSRDLQGHKVVHRAAHRNDVDEVRSTFVRGAESAIIALPGDRDLPAGKRLRRRPQLQVDCEPVDAKASKCRMRFRCGYGTETLDQTCRPLCAMGEIEGY